MTTISYVFRASSKGCGFPGSIYLRIIHKRKVKSVTVASRIYKEEWDKDRECVILPENNPLRFTKLEELDERLGDIKTLFSSLVAKLEKQGYYTLDDIIAHYHLFRDSGKLLSYAEILAKRMEKAGQERTADAYRTVAKGLVKFNKGKDIPLSQINASLIKEFESDLKAKGKQPNTISFYMRNLRAIYNKAVAEKRIHAKREKPFQEVFTGVKKTYKRALSIDEVTRLHEINFPELLQAQQPDSKEYGRIKNLQYAWKLFFFCFNARGMCFVDLAYLKKENVRNGFIRYYRKKTGQLIEVKVTEEMQAIINGFAHDVRKSEYLFPIICKGGNARIQYETALRIQNSRLRELAKLANVKQKVTTHVARHSWATIGKYKNLPIGIISEGLGHASEKITYTYLASFDHSLLDDANELIITSIKPSIVVANR